MVAYIFPECAEDEQEMWHLCRPYDLFGNPFPRTSSTEVDALAPFSAKLPSSLQTAFKGPLLNWRLCFSDLAYVRRNFDENDGLVRYLRDVLADFGEDEAIVDTGGTRTRFGGETPDEESWSTITMLSWEAPGSHVRPVEYYL